MMSILRDLLLIKSVNHAARRVARVALPPHLCATFTRRLPIVDDFSFQLPSGRTIHWSPPGDTVITRHLRDSGWNGYEPESVELFYALAQHAAVTFDVGAYLGYFAMLAAGAREGNQAFAFEALPSLSQACRRLLADNPGLSVEVIAAAVGAVRGQLDLFVADDELVPDTSTNPKFRTGRRRIIVPAMRLDDFVEQRGLAALDLMKIDTETTEPDVLLGAAKSIARFRPILLIEVLSIARLAELNQFLRDFDYSCAWVSGTGLMPQRQVVPDPKEKHYNYLFFPEGKEGRMTEVVRDRLRANASAAANPIER